MFATALKPNRYNFILAFFIILLALLSQHNTAFAQESCGLQASLVNDGDYTKSQVAKAVFGKGWSIRNDGRCDWPRDLALVLVSGDRMSGPSRMPLNSVAPSKVLNINIDLQAPQKAGQYAGVWQLEGRWCALRAPPGCQHLGLRTCGRAQPAHRLRPRPD